MRYLLCLLIILIALFNLKFSAFAQTTDYVLPYPSFMPGSKFYSVHQIWEKISRYWHFGNLAQFKYNLSQADKYLVEAKTLLEYKQYLLGYQALKKSDIFFSMAPFYLQKAKQEGKNIDEKKRLLDQAALKHIEVLTSIQSVVPEHFVWKPEKDGPTNLSLQESIQNSILIRTQSR